MKSHDDAPQPLKDYLRYLKLVKNRSDLTIHNYYTDLRSFLRYYKYSSGKAAVSIEEFNTIDISDITERDIKQMGLITAQDFLIFQDEKMNNGQKAKYRKAVAIRQFFKYLTNNKLLFETNPMANLELSSPKAALPKYLTLEQAMEMLNNINTPAQKRDYCIVTFFLNCGMRLSELVGINVKDIRSTHDAYGNEIHSLKVVGKGSKERIVYLNDACISAFNSYLDPSVTDEAERIEYGLRPLTCKTDALFVSKRGTRISNRRVQQIVEDCFKSCGLDNMGLSVHKLRHTAATLMYQNGVDVRVLKEVLGHENLNTTQIYTHVSNAQMQNAIMNNPLNNVKKD